jgi:formylglycine-generating enzyme required for sulfatase activity
MSKTKPWSPIVLLTLGLGLAACEAATTSAAGDVASELAFDWLGHDGDASAQDDGLDLPDGPGPDGCASACPPADVTPGACERYELAPASCECVRIVLAEAAPCDDGDPCTVEDTCSADGACSGYARAGLCDDGEPCTDDACTPGVGCTHAPNTAVCDDGSPCTLDDRCQGGACTSWAPNPACGPCDTENDTCETAWGDGDPCNGVLACQAGTCVVNPATRVVCPPTDGVACWATTCAPATGACVLAPADGGACVDGNPCTRDEVCGAGACQGSALATLPGCGCASNDDCAPLDDANACNGGLRCVEGLCRVAAGSVPQPCDPIENTPCRVNTCEPATGTCGVAPRADGVACDDGWPCTGAGACFGGECEPGDAIDCSPADSACLEGVCDDATGLCVGEPWHEGMACESVDPCALAAICDAGVCAATSIVACDDDDPCTHDACDSATGDCVFTLQPNEQPEVCNGFDDDCDGLTDAADGDTIVDDLQACENTLGLCAGAPKPASACVGGSWAPCGPAAYAAHAPAFEAGAEVSCDGLDNDCDGATDEQLGTVPANCGKGACLVTTTGLCVNGQVVSDCVPNAPLSATDASCNAVDDDCDGQTDEDVSKTTTTCGEGPCASTGVLACVAGVLVDSCVPKPPTAEACDLEDNDCDGSTDEDDDGPCLPGLACRKGQCLPDDMELVPAGQYWRGCNPSLDPDCSSNEKPGHLVYVDGYLIDRTEVTASRYKACMDGGACTAPDDAAFEPDTKPNHPVSGVSWDQASAFCAWMDRRLPTEAEWEKAARGGCELYANCPTQARVYPWGAESPNCSLAHYADCTSTGGTTSVGTHATGASPYGVLDLAGNAAEWVADWYEGLYDEFDDVNPKGPELGTYRVIRGGNAGSTNGTASRLRASYRTDDVAHVTWGGAQKGALGFRCALFLADM